MKINEITLYLEILVDYYGLDYIKEIDDKDLIELCNNEFDIIIDITLMRGAIDNFITISDNVKTLTNCGIIY